MSLPPLVQYPTPGEYRAHYEQVYCRGVISTFDGIRVYFSADRFGHAFYESNPQAGHKGLFSEVRAQRIDWIKATLAHPEARLYEGWIKATGQYDAARRVAVVHEDFAVIVQMRLKIDGSLKANFVTCYQADHSIEKIEQSPTWRLESCLKQLRGSL